MRQPPAARTVGQERATDSHRQKGIPVHTDTPGDERSTDRGGPDRYGPVDLTATGSSQARTLFATVTFAVTALVATALLGLASYWTYDSAQSETEFAGLGYLLAAIVAGRAVLGLALATTGFCLRRTKAIWARVLTATGLVATLLPALFLLGFLTLL